MSSESSRPKAKVTRASLVKMDVKPGEDENIPEDAAQHPEKYPRIAEVMDARTGEVLYRRE